MKQLAVRGKPGQLVRLQVARRMVELVLDAGGNGTMRGS
jgi:hypothetical protein